MAVSADGHTVVSNQSEDVAALDGVLEEAAALYLAAREGSLASSDVSSLQEL